MGGAAQRTRWLIQEKRAQHKSSPDETWGALGRQVTSRAKAGHRPTPYFSKLRNSVAMKPQCIRDEE